MGEPTTGATYGDELLSAPNGPARVPGNAGTLGRIRGRVATITGRDAEEEAQQGGGGARISTGEQVAGKARTAPRSPDTGERATVQEATSASKSTLSPLRLASRLASMGLGIDASITPEEQADIAEPLTRIYQRNPRVAAYVNRYTDPAMLFLAVLSYVGRIWLTYQQTQLVRAQAQLAQAQQRQQPVPLRPEVPPAPPIRGERTATAKVEGPSFAELRSQMSMGE